MIVPAVVGRGEQILEYRETFPQVSRYKSQGIYLPSWRTSERLPSITLVEGGNDDRSIDREKGTLRRREDEGLERLKQDTGYTGKEEPFEACKRISRSV